MEIFDKTFSALEKKMDLHFRRHVTLAGNIANSETPNFRAREVDFAGELEKALGEKKEVLVKTHPQHMDLSSHEGAHVVFDNSTPVGADGNNVDLDIATGKLSSNAREYSGAANLMMIKLRILRMAAMGRGGI